MAGHMKYFAAQTHAPMAGEKSELAGHVSQYVLPGSGWCLPSSHAVHFAALLVVE